MKQWTTALVANTLVFALAASSDAAELSTPGIEAGNSTEGVTCLARNVSKKATDITLEIFNFFGSSVAGPKTGTVAPGTAAFLPHPGAAGTNTSVYCVISGKFGKKSVRGSMYVLDADGTSIGTVQAE